MNTPYETFAQYAVRKESTRQPGDEFSYVIDDENDITIFDSARRNCNAVSPDLAVADAEAYIAKKGLTGNIRVLVEEWESSSSDWTQDDVNFWFEIEKQENHHG